MRHAIACICFLLTLFAITAQEPLTNETILKLVKAGIGEDTIVGMVNQQAGRYSLAADDVVALKNAGVSEKIIAAMVVKAATSNAGSTSSKSGQHPGESANIIKRCTTGYCHQRPGAGQDSRVGTSGTVTLNLDTTKVPQLNSVNTFTSNQGVIGTITATGSVGVGTTSPATMLDVFSTSNTNGPMGQFGSN